MCYGACGEEQRERAEGSTAREGSLGGSRAWGKGGGGAKQAHRKALGTGDGLRREGGALEGECESLQRAQARGGEGGMAEEYHRGQAERHRAILERLIADHEAQGEMYRLGPEGG
jgi:hypothetical protein